MCLRLFDLLPFEQHWVRRFALLNRITDACQCGCMARIITKCSCCNACQY